MQPPNGILAYVRGPDVAAGAQMLPKACAEESAERRRTVVVDAEHVGPVRITYRLNSYRHRAKSKFCHWVAEHAEKVEPAA